MSKKQTKKIKPPSIKIAVNEKQNEKQLEFDFSAKYIIQWHCINEDPNLKNKKGYKTRVKTVKDPVDDSQLLFSSLENAENYIQFNLVSQFIYHEMSLIIKLQKNIDKPNPDNLFSGFTKLNATTFTYGSKESYIKYWIEIKQL